MSMILLDTNVISEPLKAQGDARVLAWIDAQMIETLYLSTIALAELRYGIAVLSKGRRKEILSNSLEQKILPLFAGRILAFDEPASTAYAQIRAQARAKGLAVATADGYIAAIAKAHGLTVATRDVQPFVAAGVKVVNPWGENQGV